MAKFPTYEEMSKNVAEKALDEFLYDGKSIREWMQIIASEDVISRQEALKYFEGWKNQIKYYHPYAKNFDIPYEEAIQRIKDVPPVKCVSSENPNKCEDVISRKAVLDATVNKNSIWNNITNSEGDNLETIVSNLPPVNPQKTDEQILTEIFVIYQKRIPAIAYKSNYIPRMGDIIHFPHFGGFRVKSVAYRIADDAGIDGNRLMWVELFVDKYEEINCKTTKCENAGGMNVQI